MRITSDMLTSVTSVNVRKQKSGPEDLLALNIDCEIEKAPLAVAADIFGCGVEDLARLFNDEDEPTVMGIDIKAADRDFPHDVLLGGAEDRAVAVRKIRLKPITGRVMTVSWRLQVSEPSDEMLLEAAAALTKSTVSLVVRSRQLEAVDSTPASQAA